MCNFFIFHNNNQEIKNQGNITESIKSGLEFLKNFI